MSAASPAARRFVCRRAPCSVFSVPSLFFCQTMNRIADLRLHLVAVALFLSSSGFSVQAAKPEWVEDGKAAKASKNQSANREGGQVPLVTPAQVSVDIRIGGYFGQPHHAVVREYYEPRMRAGKCPPGLKKKNNGCMPPGLAKAWKKGEVLSPAVVSYPVPAHIQVRLGTPPAGHKFVRVAADILLIAVGTSMVIDAIEDLGRL